MKIKQHKCCVCYLVNFLFIILKDRNALNNLVLLYLKALFCVLTVLYIGSIQINIVIECQCCTCCFSSGLFFFCSIGNFCFVTYWVKNDGL